jgi:D-3-phosphoglycerate dehydrogenase / 2-oxoglutarate reductase
VVEGAALEKQCAGNGTEGSNPSLSARGETQMKSDTTFIIDFDSTIIRCESLEELARLALHSRSDCEEALRRLQELTDQGMAGELSFDESLRRRLQLFAADKGHLEELISLLEKEITPSVNKHRDWFARNSDYIYIISGGFEEYIVPVVALLGIAADHVLANAFRLDGNGGIVGHDESRHLSKAGGKVRQVAALNLPRPVIVIGDGYTDYEIRAAGKADEFWAFCENVNRPSVTKHADKILKSFDEVVMGSELAVQ